MNKKLVFFSFITVVALGVATFFSLKIFEKSYFNETYYKVPDLKSFTLEEAEELLTDNNLNIRNMGDEFSELPVGEIFMQEPEPDSIVKKNRNIKVWVSKGEALVEVPQLVGMNFLDAKAIAEQKGLIVDRVASTKAALPYTMPCLIISSVSANKNGIPYQDLFLSMIILIIILPIFAYLCLKISSLKDKSLYLFMIIYPNVGFIGFPLLQSLFGKQSLLLTALINMPFNLSLFTLGMMIMSNNKSFQIKKLITPGIIASLIAVLLYIFSISLPETLLQPIQLIGNMTTPLAMIIIGATLSKYPIKKILLDRKIYLFTIFIDLIIPMIFSPLVHFLIKDTMIQAMTMIILGMPVANGAVLFAKRYQQNEFLAAKTVFLSTLLSIITIPVVALCFI